MNIGAVNLRQSGVRRIDLRRVAEHHAAGVEWQKTPAETQRMLRLALNEAEALAMQTGLPELVLPGLAEEKVQSLRHWAARQRKLREAAGTWKLQVAALPETETQGRWSWAGN